MGGISASREFMVQVERITLTEWKPNDDDYTFMFGIHNVSAYHFQRYIFTTSFWLLPYFDVYTKNAYIRRSEQMYADRVLLRTGVSRRVDEFEGSAQLVSNVSDETRDPLNHSFTLYMYPSFPMESFRFEHTFKVGMAPIDAPGYVYSLGDVVMTAR